MEVGVGLFSTGGGRGRSNLSGDWGGRDKFQSQLFLMMCQVWWLQKRMDWGGQTNYPIATIFDDVVGAVVTEKSYWFDSCVSSLNQKYNTGIAWNPGNEY